MTQSGSENAPLILCCEDEPHLRADIADELREAGYRVVEAASGPNALAALQSLHPDLILCDIMMPGLDGYCVLERLRHDHPLLADVPFVFLTALSPSDAVVKGKRAGADDYLTKPIDYDLMLATIDARLRQVRRWREGLPAASRIGQTLLERLNIGVLVFDRTGSLSYANPVAATLLEVPGASGGAPRLPAPLPRSVKELCQAALAEQERSISVRLGCEDHDQELITVLYSRPLAGAAESEPAVIAFLTNPAQRQPLSPQCLAELFELTPSETQVAIKLAEGKRPDEIAETLAVSPTTVAFHLRNIFSKTDTNRQADLVALLLSLPLRQAA
ncbi:response regulator [Aquibaculum arenosum]|uniref:Response regulator n=1 Tax=Aquibaculum arenosum TaxID=3032591 RepID=A0ABT5YIR9_9PROT|nr:response regulator [Fodinicurvata sp. CAU 1616]MDF2094782.1 response regulator [Fodinicurvata sp. CAU 1616]